MDDGEVLAAAGDFGDLVVAGDAGVGHTCVATSGLIGAHCLEGESSWCWSRRYVID